VWDVNSSRARLGSSLEGHVAPVLELETGPPGVSVSGDRSGHVIVWDLNVGASAWRLKNVHRGHVTSLAWYGEDGEDAHLLMSGGQVPHPPVLLSSCHSSLLVCHFCGIW
jgi:F-box/WD-40 domain protein 7